MKFNLVIITLLLVCTSCVQPKPRKPVVRKTSSFLDNSVSLNKKLIAKQETQFKKLMDKDSLSRYKNSSLGFWYKINTKSNQTYLPKKGDKLHFKYEVSTLENKIIYSFNETGTQTYFLDEQEIIEGFRDGLKLMNEGDEFTFLFPSHKVYGYIGDQNKIEINQPLIINIKLIKIEKNETN